MRKLDLDNLPDGWVYHQYPVKEVDTCRLSETQLHRVRELAADDVRVVLEFMEEFDTLLAVKLEAWQIPVMYMAFFNLHKKEALNS